MSLYALDQLRLARSELRAATTVLWRASQGCEAVHRLQVLYLVQDLVKKQDELAARIAAEVSALEAAHPFTPGFRGLWCARCGAAADRHAKSVVEPGRAAAGGASPP